MSLITRFTLVVAALSGCVAAAPVSSSPPSFTNAQIKLIRANAIEGSTKSWELGTLLEALTELDAYHLSAFGAESLPVKASSGKLPQDALRILDEVLDKRPSGLQAFMVDGSAADPASLGPHAVVAGITTGKSKYADAAADQLDWVLNSVPRDSKNVTVSHRQELFQAWADYVSMIPPFLGMYAASQGGDEGAGLMAFAHQQIKGYREHLRDPETGIWRHITGGKWSDTGLWATGNAWAAHGALRVEAAIAKGPYAYNMKSEVADIQRWVGEIIAACWNEADENGLIHNYMRQDTFADSAGSALLAAATYRHAFVTQNTTYIHHAEKAFRGVLDLVDKDGWVHSAVDPYNFKDVTDRSPEAESFLLLLHVASQKFYEWQESPARVLATALLQGLSANVKVDA